MRLFDLLPLPVSIVLRIVAVVVGLSLGFYFFGARRAPTVFTERTVHGWPSPPPEPDASDH